MTLSNGATIEKTDLDGGFTTPLSNLQADNARITTGSLLHFHFQNLISTTGTAFRTVVFVAADDQIVEDISVAGGNTSGTVTCTLSGTGIITPISITFTSVGGSLTDATRLFSSSTQEFISLIRGATYTLTVSTSDAAAPADGQNVTVGIVLRPYFRRE